MMAIANTRLEARAHAGLQQMLARIVNQRDFTLNNKDEFILILVPMAVGRP